MLAYLLSDDLIFTSRITGTASALGHEVRSARSAGQLVNLLAQQSPQCLLVDLHNPGLSIADLVSRWRQLQRQGRAPSPEELCADCPERLAELQRMEEENDDGRP